MLASWKIVYIDDSHLELRAVEKSLREAGCEVVTSAHGEGLENVIRGADLVLIDFHLAGTTGLSVLTRVRKQFELSGDPCPLLYLYTSDRDIGADYRALGFDGRIILKGNQEALIKQVEAVQRAQKLRLMRPKH